MCVYVRQQICPTHSVNHLTCFSDPDDMNISTQLKEWVDVVTFQVDIRSCQTLAYTIVVEVKVSRVCHLHTYRFIFTQKPKTCSVTIVLLLDILWVHLIKDFITLVDNEVVCFVLRASWNIRMAVDMAPLFVALKKAQKDLPLVRAYAVVIRDPDKDHLHLRPPLEGLCAVTYSVTPVVATAGDKQIPREVSVSPTNWMKPELYCVGCDAVSFGVLREDFSRHVRKWTSSRNHLDFWA